MPSQAELDKKREENIKNKEAEKQKKVEEIKANKAAKQKERDEQRSKEAAAADEKAKKQQELDAKRESNIAAKKKGGASKGSSKYSKNEIQSLKKVFDDYDKDRSGKISIEEFGKELTLKKQNSAPKPGEKSTLEQRKAQEGIGIADLSESVFHEMDKDGDGEVTFEELLRLNYQYARDDEIKTMLSWVAAPPEPEPEPKPELSAEAKKSINAIFKLYDTDKSGTLTMKELKIALTKTGIDPEEIEGYFKEYDKDDSASIDKAEFLLLMESTGAFDEM